MRKAASGFGFLLASSAGAARGLIKPGPPAGAPGLCGAWAGGREGVRVEEATWQVAVHRRP